MAHKSKLYGLTISTARLFQIRKDRRAHGRYATQPKVTWDIPRPTRSFAATGVERRL